ncbi:hypothetical protein PR048_009641 [Dryococelus australis]|uniref:Secreted protein n=1 Tax=Dryococelus australis TaxID=614101 RepID=A0ABQ9I0J8_9NEOP|nr:hypothetical protein PR048_009641 [Dryococelus australis]
MVLPHSPPLVFSCLACVLLHALAVCVIEAVSSVEALWQHARRLSEAGVRRMSVLLNGSEKTGKQQCYVKMRQNA